MCYFLFQMLQAHVLSCLSTVLQVWDRDGAIRPGGPESGGG